MGIRVVVAEDSLLVREGIVKLLEAGDEVEVVALCEDLPGLLEAVAATNPDVVLTDIRMPPTGTDEGIRAAATLRSDHPHIGVVVLSQYAEPAYALELFDEGSEGRAYLLKERVADGVCVLGLKFTHDKLSPPERFERLREELGDGFVGVEIDSSPGNPHGFDKTAHSVLTRELVDEPGHPTREALDQVLDLFRERLLA